MIRQEVLPCHYRWQEVAVVAIKSLFSQVGARTALKLGIIGERKRKEVIKEGFAEEDLAGDTFPGSRKGRKAAATELNAFKDDAVHERNQLQVHKDADAYIDNPEGLGGVTDPHPKRRQGRAIPPGRCDSCIRIGTPKWRRGPDIARTLCNVCGLRMSSFSYLTLRFH